MPSKSPILIGIFINRAVVAILKLVGPGPYPPKKVVGPGPGFTLFPPKSGGARAQLAHTPTPALIGAHAQEVSDK